MRAPTFIATLLLLTAASAYTPPAYWRNVPPPLDDYRADYRNFKASQLSHDPHPQPRISTPDQTPMAPAQDPEQDAESSQSHPQPQPHTTTQLTISDILPQTRAINIFASLTRDIETLTSRLSNTNSQPTNTNTNTTLLAPLNTAMQSLPRKPWENRPDVSSSPSSARHGTDEDTAAANLRRFVLEHVVPVSPWLEGKQHAVATLGQQEEDEKRGVSGAKIWWETRGGGADGSQARRVIMPGEIVVEGVVGRVGNGEIWALKGVVNYE